MEKQQIKTQIEEKHKEKKMVLKDGEFEQIWDSKSKESNEFVEQRVQTHFKRKLLSNAPSFYGIVLCASEVKDFGATKMYNTMVDSWNRASEEVRKVLVNSKQYDVEGNPLWSDINAGKANWKYMDKNTGQWKQTKERKINLEREVKREVTLVGRKVEESDLKKTTLTLWGDKVNQEVPVGYQVNFRANGNIDEQGSYKLNSASVTEFLKVSEDKISNEDLLKVVDTFLPNEKVDFNKELPSQGLLTTRQLVVITNAIVSRVTETKENANSNAVTISGLVGGLDENEEVTCWISKTLPLDVKVDDNVVVFAQPQQKTDKLSVNVLGMYNLTKKDSKKVEGEW
ncbi:MAG: hypothetical protein Q7R52_00140 [archaeon]|nr:hypothetical protein [archaeon]